MNKGQADDTQNMQKLGKLCDIKLVQVSQNRGK